MLHCTEKKLQARVIYSCAIFTTNQLTYVLTKALCKKHFSFLIGKLGLHNLYAPAWGGIIVYFNTTATNVSLFLCLHICFVFSTASCHIWFIFPSILSLIIYVKLPLYICRHTCIITIVKHNCKPLQTITDLGFKVIVIIEASLYLLMLCHKALLHKFKPGPNYTLATKITKKRESLSITSATEQMCDPDLPIWNTHRWWRRIIIRKFNEI